ncbi:response regulator transcription factor [Luteimonas abyssi]|uniref:response regulator transcription factor n=1 Tax=Luteimonas abyssi TaxID=1247514 RepID=UPI000737B022|nr:response regulator transcription factor [Luteimonas abyssi]
MRILLAEDDAELAGRIAAVLAEAGFAVDRVADGGDAEFRGQTEAYDAVVLDLGLPGLDGVSVLHRWREADRRMPVLVLTARARWHDKLAGFDAGADDYLTKPFQLEELVLRLRALIRRSVGHASPRLQCGALELDANAGRFVLDGTALALSPQEYRILAYLMHHAGRVVSRAELGEHVYDNGYDPDSNVLDVLVGRIRRKLGVPLLQTVRGQGFRLAAGGT